VAQGNLAAAEAAVAEAQARVAQLTAGAGAGEIATAEANVSARQAEFDIVRTQYNQALVGGLAGPQEEQLRAQKEAAEAALDAARTQLEALQAGARPADLQEANVARAEAAYDRLLEAPMAAELAILEAQVEAARTNVALAELQLRQATITAPMAGTVANVLINVGEQATPGAPAVTLVNEEAFHIEVSVDEIDIDQVTLGQEVEITLDALPDTVVTGTVADIAPTAAGDGVGIVTYQVTINIAAEDVPLRPGMSANAAIVVEEVDDVLVVPNWAIRLDRQSGQAFVNRLLADGSVAEVVVETGLRNEQFSEVVSGLQAGDAVVVTDEREAFSLFGN
jgi:HlyD family secretion protein